MSPSKREVGERIRSARQAAGLTQGQLADKIGYTQTAVSYWEAGKRSPSIGDLLDVAGALGVPAVQLLPLDAPAVHLSPEEEYPATSDGAGSQVPPSAVACLRLDPASVSSVLLADDWHEVRRGRFATFYVGPVEKFALIATRVVDDADSGWLVVPVDQIQAFTVNPPDRGEE